MTNRGNWTDGTTCSRFGFLFATTFLVGGDSGIRKIHPFVEGEIIREERKKKEAENFWRLFHLSREFLLDFFHLAWFFFSTFCPFCRTFDDACSSRRCFFIHRALEEEPILRKFWSLTGARDSRPLHRTLRVSRSLLFLSRFFFFTGPSVTYDFSSRTKNKEASRMDKGWKKKRVERIETKKFAKKDREKSLSDQTLTETTDTS